LGWLNDLAVNKFDVSQLTDKVKVMEDCEAALKKVTDVEPE